MAISSRTRLAAFAAGLALLLGGAASAAELEGPATIIYDQYRVPTVVATTEHDAIFLQGYLHARDRLFQLELWRRQATGTVAEILGPKELTRDIGTRLHLFRGDISQELNHYHPRGEAIVQAFVDGINAYVAEVESQPDLLPLEFELLGINRLDEFIMATPAIAGDRLLIRAQGKLYSIREDSLRGAE